MSSHSSPGSMTPLPQLALMHAFEQPSLLTWLPSSHCSRLPIEPMLSTRPSPQTLILQCEVQSLLSLLFVP